MQMLGLLVTQNADQVGCPTVIGPLYNRNVMYTICSEAAWSFRDVSLIISILSFTGLLCSVRRLDSQQAGD